MKRQNDEKMTNVESELSSTGLEQSECRSSHMVIWTNGIPTILYLFWEKREKRFNTREKQSFN